MLQIALIVALICVIPCFLGLCVIWMQVMAVKTAITRAEQNAQTASEKTISIEARLQDVDLPNLERINAKIAEAEAAANRAFLRSEGVMEAHLTLVNRLNARERDAAKKEKRAAKEAEQPEEIDESEPVDLQYNLLHGGTDQMPVSAARPGQISGRRRRFGEPPLPSRAQGV